MWARKTLLAAVVLLLATPSIAQDQVQAEKFAPVDIFITSYKGPSANDVGAYHRSEVGQAFESELQSDDDERFCLKSAKFEETTGLWEGSTEPSWWMHALGRRSDAEAYAVEHAGKHEQDAVLLFLADPNGPDAEYVLTFSSELLVPQTAAALQEAGFKGATFSGKKLLLIDNKPANADAARKLAQALGAEFSEVRGRRRLISSPEYKRVLESYESVPHTCPLQ